MRVLIVEDEKSLAQEIETFLKNAHYICDMVHNGADALDKCDENSYDFLLLDLGLPDKDGLELLETIKKDLPDIAVVILTARGNVEDRIKGLDLGADDYIPKPFSLHELHARMHAITRRKFNINDFQVVLDEFTIDTKTRLIHHKEQEIELSRKEFDLLNYLILHKNRPLTRMQLSEHLWGDFSDDDYDSNYIDVHIKNIRKKLSAYGPVDWLETVRGVGYKIKKQD